MPTLRNTIRWLISQRAPNEKTLLPWAQRELVPWCQGVQTYLLQAFRTKVGVASTGTAGWEVAWTGDAVRTGSMCTVVVDAQCQSGANAGSLQVVSVFANDGTTTSQIGRSATTTVYSITSAAFDVRVVLVDGAPQVQVKDAGAITNWSLGISVRFPDEQ